MSALEESPEVITRYYDSYRGQPIIGKLALQQFYEVGGQEVQLEELRDTKYYYDLTTGQLLLGDKALETHLETGAHTNQIYELAELITNRDIDLSLLQKQNTFRYKKLTRQDCLAYGQWLQTLLKNYDPEASFGFEEIVRTSKLGIGPHYKQIQYRFGGDIDEFYEGLGRDIQPQKRRFGDWGIRRFIDHVHKLAWESKRDRKPITATIKARAEGGKKEPSLYILDKKAGSIANLLELDGKKNIEEWDEIDHIDWGIKYRLANNGLMPHHRIFVQLSKKGLGPSVATIQRKFGSITSYQELLRKGYVQKTRERKDQLKAIRQASWHGYINPAIFNGAKSDDEILKQYNKYSLLTDSDFPDLNDLDEDVKIDLCRRYKDLSFIIELIALHEEAGVEDTAEIVSKLLEKHRRLYLDNYMDKLRVGQ